MDMFASLQNLLASSGQDQAPDDDGGDDGGGGVCTTGMVMTDEEEEEEDEAAPEEVQTCIECEDQHAELVCLSCEEPFCRPCWGSLHR